jgi:DNA-binding MarR family transcriptional regulator
LIGSSAAGFIRRPRDEHDRRRIFVVSTGQHESETTRLYAPLANATATVLDHYNVEQLALVANFLERLNQANAELLRERAGR